MIICEERWSFMNCTSLGNEMTVLSILVSSSCKVARIIQLYHDTSNKINGASITRMGSCGAWILLPALLWRNLTFLIESCTQICLSSETCAQLCSSSIFGWEIVKAPTKRINQFRNSNNVYKNGRCGLHIPFQGLQKKRRNKYTAVVKKTRGCWWDIEWQGSNPGYYNT